MEHLLHIHSVIADELSSFNRRIAGTLTHINPLLNGVITHLKQQNGKLMRPILVLLTARLFSDRVTETTKQTAVALELLHTASLIHDDVVDQSDERRGKRSLNAVYNNKVAVLAGDLLLATSSLEASKTKNPAILSQIAMLGQTLSQGELLQLSHIADIDSFDEKVYFDIIRMKTAALFAACTELGALSVGASADDCERARLLGEYIGICFQIKDDIFDYDSSAEKEIGKPTGNDMMEGKLTLPALHVLQKADENVRALAMRIRQGQGTPEEIAQLVTLSKREGGIEYAIAVMDDHRRRAETLLASFPDTPVRTAMYEYVDYVVGRRK
ncbi:MAG: polyprenyl synthetase family protein [Prevotellaceae bacterium]|jgi:octaprenyl-diphosphate synthase|nr:polyprenyl synthetase family protein [Prevotellaceae bacterium]